MKINIYGSTGVIGKKTLSLIDKNFPNLKIGLLCAKSNLKLLTKQIKKYKPKYAFLHDHEKITNFENNDNNKTFVDVETFAAKVATIKDGFFKESTEEEVLTEKVDSANEVKTIVEGEVDPMSKLPADMAKYVQQLSKFNK